MDIKNLVIADNYVSSSIYFYMSVALATSAY